MTGYKGTVQGVAQKLGGYGKRLYSEARDLFRDAQSLRREGLSSLSVYPQREPVISIPAGYAPNGYAGTDSRHGGTREYGTIISLGPGYPPRLPVGSKI